MIIRNVTKDDLFKALEIVNKKYENNILFDYEPKPKGKAWQVKLTVRNSNKKNGSVSGSRLGQSGIMGYGIVHHIKAACWHVHGDFFDALPPKRKIICGRVVYNPGENWQDFNIGPIMNPVYYSEACDCRR